MGPRWSRGVVAFVDRVSHRGVTAAWLVVVAVGMMMGSCESGDFGPKRPRCRGVWSELAGGADRTTVVACVPRGKKARRVRGPARLLLGQPIELNRASAATLEILPGIGFSRAQSIVRARCRTPFLTLGELVRISGIGPRTVEGLRGLAVAGSAPRPEDCRLSTTLLP